MFYTQDIRYAFRLLRRSPGFALLTILVLAGGLGLSTFTFSFLYSAMVRPLPLNDGASIVRLTQLDEGRRTTTSPADIANIRTSVRGVQDIGGYTKHEMMLGRERDTRTISVTIAEPQLFRVARMPAALGRTLQQADAATGAEPVIVLSDRLWKLAFQSDANAINSLMTINGVSTRVVGVMPEGFGFPVTQDAWSPLSEATFKQAGASIDSDNQERLQLFARLAPGVTHEQAAAEVTMLLKRSIASRDTSHQQAARSAMTVESFPAAQIGDERTIVFTGINLAAALILLLALMNVTTLLTARANERIRETAVRLALGASRGRLVMQGMWETIILCVAGGILGTAGAAYGLTTITNWTRINMPGGMAFWWVWQMDRVTLMSAGAFVTVAIAILGCVVSVRATKTNVREVMQDGSARAGSKRDGRMSRILVATQVTTVTVLMYAGVLSAIMGQRVLTIDPGYDASKLLQVGFAPPADKFATDAERATVFREITKQLNQQSALDGALLRTKLANKGGRSGAFETRQSQATSQSDANIVATLGAVNTLGIKTVQGRLLDDRDDATREPVAVVSQSLATRMWPGRSPIGQQLRFAAVADTAQWRTVVGIVSDVPYGSQLARDRSTDAIYIPLLQSELTATDVYVRYRANETDGRLALNATFGAIDPALVPGFVYRSAEVARQAGLLTLGMAKLFGGCFAFALLLALAGTYGLMSRSIGLRTREIGVRRALGATDADASRLLLTQGARQLGIGSIIAVPILAIVGALSAHFFPLGGFAVASSGIVVTAAILAAVLAATYLPTRRVIRIGIRDALWRE